MKNSVQNILILSLIIFIFFVITKIQLLIIYFFIAAVLSITINPLSNLIVKVKFLKFKVNTTIAAIICLCVITTIGGMIGFILSPIIIEEIQIISSIQLIEIQNFLDILTQEINKKFSSNLEPDFVNLLKVLNISSISGLFQSMLEILGNLFMAIFSILFISFFLIKDKRMLKEKTINTISKILPNAPQKINMIIYFIRRYFLGLCTQTTILFILFGFGMMIIDLPNAWTLAVFAAVINIIPYFGPLIGFFFTITMVGTFYLDQNMIESILPLITKSFILFGSIQAIDNFILQPTIFSRAFKAHPLEIFFVAMGAGFIGGILWMIIAMPVYTIFRIVFSELITNLK